MKIEIKAEVGEYVYMYPTFYSTPFKNGDKVQLKQVIHTIELIDYEFNEEHIKNVTCDNFLIKKINNKNFLIYNLYLFEGHDTLYNDYDFDLKYRT
jgi:hypothetical protein